MAKSIMADIKDLKNYLNSLKKIILSLVGEKNHKFKFSHSIPAYKDTIKIRLSGNNFLILVVYPEIYEEEVENIVSEFNKLAE